MMSATEGPPLLSTGTVGGGTGESMDGAGDSPLLPTPRLELKLELNSTSLSLSSLLPLLELPRLLLLVVLAREVADPGDDDSEPANDFAVGEGGEQLADIPFLVMERKERKGNVS